MSDILGVFGEANGDGVFVAKRKKVEKLSHFVESMHVIFKRPVSHSCKKKAVELLVFVVFGVRQIEHMVMYGKSHRSK